MPKWTIKLLAKKEIKRETVVWREREDKNNAILKMWYESEVQKCKKNDKSGEKKKQTLAQLIDDRKKMKWNENVQAKKTPVMNWT